MDRQGAEELLHWVQNAGAVEARLSVCRGQKLIDSLRRQGIESRREDFSTLMLEFRLNGELYRQPWPSQVLSRQRQKQLVQESLNMAKLSQAWQRQSERSLGQQAVPYAQPAWPCQLDEAEQSAVFAPEKLDRCQAIMAEAERLKALSSGDFLLEQSLSWGRLELFSEHDSQALDFVETVLDQSYDGGAARHFRLPQHRSFWPAELCESSGRAKWLALSEVLEPLQKAQKGQSSSLGKHFGLLLSPWASAVVLRASRKLPQEDLLRSRRLVLDFDSLWAPSPSAGQPCESLALMASRSPESSPELMRAGLSGRVLYGLAPSLVLGPKAGSLCLIFALAASIEGGSIQAYHRDLKLSFSLHSFWEKISSVSRHRQSFTLSQAGRLSQLYCPYLYAHMPLEFELLPH